MYFIREDIRDQLLKNVLGDADINESTLYIENLAARLGVLKKEIQIPASYPIQKLAMHYALMICAENQSMMNKSRDEPGEDSYEKKRAVHEERVNYWERQITKETFVGFSGQSAGPFMPLTIKMERC